MGGTVIPGNQPSATPLEQFPLQGADGSLTWVVDIASVSFSFDGKRRSWRQGRERESADVVARVGNVSWTSHHRESLRCLSTPPNRILTSIG